MQSATKNTIQDVQLSVTRTDSSVLEVANGIRWKGASLIQLYLIQLEGYTFCDERLATLSGKRL